MDTEERHQLKLRIDRKRRESLKELKKDYSGIMHPEMLLETHGEVEDLWLRVHPKVYVTKRDTSFHPPRGFRYNSQLESRHQSYLFARPTNLRY